MALSADEVAELYDRHAEAILAVRRTWDPEVAVDILAETFAVALVARHRFRGHDREAERAWLYGIARHELADHFRRARAQRRALARLGIERRPLTDVEYERIEELAGSSELRDCVSEKLEALPVDQPATAPPANSPFSTSNTSTTATRRRSSAPPPCTQPPAAGRAGGGLSWTVTKFGLPAI